MNKVILIGRLTDNPEFSTTTNGIQLCRFRLAVGRTYKTADGDTDFINIVVWRALADTCRKYLFKGSQCCVVGSLQTRSYEKDGQRRYVSEVVADNVEFLARPGGGAINNENPTEKKSTSELTPYTGDDDLPF